MATQVKVAAGGDLQAAINAASSGDVVLVQAGTYVGNFTMKDGVNVSGGWNADFTAQTEHTSILDAKANGRVLNQPANFTTLTIWDNFTIQNGFLAAYVDQWGPGVVLLKNGRVSNCLVQNNSFGGEYAGNCAGGGICNNTAGDTCAINCIVRNNKATHGGGIRAAGIVINCIVENNEATGNGGGVYIHLAGQLHNSIVRNNLSTNNVGGVDITGSGAIVNCLIYGNKANNQIGGLYIRLAANVINCTIVKNDHGDTGNNAIFAGIRSNSNNQADYNGKLFVNNIVWGNTLKGELQTEQVHTNLKYYGTNGVCSNNALQGANSIGVKYIALAADNAAASGPQFGTNYECAATSPLYNAGSNEALTYLVGDKDVYGNARVQNGVIEIGAVESVTKYYVAEGSDLQAAVNKASAGDTVLVQAGTYEGNFIMKDGVFVSGGWNADFTAQTEHASILDANNSGRVLNQPAGFNKLTIWDNFTIQNGFLAAYFDEWGPGVALLKNGRVTNCLVQNNSYGPEYSGKCVGGGICNNSGGDTCAINCIVRNNKATHGGGIRTAGVAINCLVENNEATTNGGGVYLHYLGKLHNSVVRNNVSKKDVGGVDMIHLGCAIYNCLVVENHADSVIGGVQARTSNNVVNTTIVGNSHNTVESGKISWAGFRASDGTADNYKDKLFVNNVIWGNKHNGDVVAEQVMSNLQHYATNGTFANNALQGTADIKATYIQLSAANDPQFDANYECAATSPLYNAGNNDALPHLLGDKDVYGHARKQNGVIEIGAVECAMALLSDGNNAVVIEANEGETVSVLVNRTFTAGDGYYTICLPFDLAASEIGTAYQLASVTAYDANEGFNVNFKEATTLEAGQPYLVLPSKNLTNPVFENVTIVNTTDTVADVASGEGIKVAFTGVLNGGGKTNGTTEYYVGANGWLYNEATAKLGLRAFFTITDEAGNPTRVRARVVTNENAATGLEHITTTDKAAKVIVNGQLIIIRNDEKYNAMGVRL